MSHSIHIKIFTIFYSLHVTAILKHTRTVANIFVATSWFLVDVNQKRCHNNTRFSFSRKGVCFASRGRITKTFSNSFHWTVIVMPKQGLTLNETAERLRVQDKTRQQSDSIVWSARICERSTEVKIYEKVSGTVSYCIQIVDMILASKEFKVCINFLLSIPSSVETC